MWLDGFQTLYCGWGFSSNEITAEKQIQGAESVESIQHQDLCYLGFQVSPISQTSSRCRASACEPRLPADPGIQGLSPAWNGFIPGGFFQFWVQPYLGFDLMHGPLWHGLHMVELFFVCFWHKFFPSLLLGQAKLRELCRATLSLQVSVLLGWVFWVCTVTLCVWASLSMTQSHFNYLH